MKNTACLPFIAGLIVLLQGCAVSLDSPQLHQQLTEHIARENEQITQKTDSLPESLAAVQNLLHDKDFKKALKKTDNWLQENLQSPHRDLALYYKGRALFERRLYYQAFESFDKLLQEYPGTELFTPAVYHQMEIGRRFLAGAKRKVWGFLPSSAHTEGLAILEQVVDQWPGSELAAQAIMLQADYHYINRQFLDAQHFYQRIVQEYPAGRLYPQALLRSAEATYALYRGPYYDTQCLRNAQIRFGHFLQEFPEKARELGIPEEIEKIQHQRVLKYMEVADFYLRTGHSQAAVNTWLFIIQEWPDSSWARQARQLIRRQQEILEG